MRVISLTRTWSHNIYKLDLSIVQDQIEVRHAGSILFAVTTDRQKVQAEVKKKVPSEIKVADYIAKAAYTASHAFTHNMAKWLYGLWS